LDRACPNSGGHHSFENLFRKSNNYWRLPMPENPSITTLSIVEFRELLFVTHLGNKLYVTLREPSVLSDSSEVIHDLRYHTQGN
jgi:hypothetical protein